MVSVGFNAAARSVIFLPILFIDLLLLDLTKFDMICEPGTNSIQFLHVLVYQYHRVLVKFV